MANISTIKVSGTSYGITPASHASTATTYGAANASNYGHVKLSDLYASSAGAAASGIGASSAAVYNAYNTLNSNNGLVLGPGTYNMKCYYVTSTYNGTVYSSRYPMLYMGTGVTGYGGACEFGMITIGGMNSVNIKQVLIKSTYSSTTKIISLTLGTPTYANNIISFTMTIPTNACVYTSRKNLTGDA